MGVENINQIYIIFEYELLFKALGDNPFLKFIIL